jgi:hypothetical protein
LYGGIKESKMDVACCAHEEDEKNHEKFTVKDLEELDLAVFGMIYLKLFNRNRCI